MKNKIILMILGAALTTGLLSGCVINAFEEELKVNFINEGEVYASGTVTQFKNIQSPVLPDAYVPDDYTFLGWTSYSEDQINKTDSSHFKTQYIGGGEMVHYMDVKKIAVNKIVNLQALIMNNDDIPREYHYVVLAWYNKPATSGINQNKMDTVEGMLKTYLTNEGVSQDDINSIVVRGYTGDVVSSTGQIRKDGDVDIMFGWGGNISSTGSIPTESVLQSETFTVPGVSTPKRYIHRLSDSDGAKKVMEYLSSDTIKNYFNPEA